ncbi:MAG: [acyl-carrier-protein] S-malonyltransferase [Chloroflexi bacterium RBG_16_54_18]|nr:MAG: [acyl-carrier-protein] S-malonyltransferase [Chloroflexi bacterium RBG_16_54_18]
MDAKSTAFLFPGQGSQSVGMGFSLAQAYEKARLIFSESDEWIGFPLSKIAWEGSEEILNDTINTQPALLVHSIAAWEVFNENFPGFRPTYVAGHSMGELSALVASGTLAFKEAFSLVRRRGELMKRSGEISPGGMAAVLGMGIAELEQVCSDACRGEEIVQVANDNCPGQVVISGSSQALERAMQLAQEHGARRVRRLAVSIAAHSPLMATAQDDFNLAVNHSPFVEPLIPLVGNVTARPLTTRDDIRADLQLQLTSRVRWTESIQMMAASGVKTFIEIGSGNVLTGLLKRILPEAEAYSIGNPEDFEQLSWL